MLLAYVAAGGALGAVLRYLCNVVLTANISHGLPWGILVVNVLGSLAIGVLVGVIAKLEAANGLWLFFGVGMLGSFTTFSTFSLETILLLQQGEFLKGFLNVMLNVALCLAATFVGLKLTGNQIN